MLYRDTKYLPTHPDIQRTHLTHLFHHRPTMPIGNVNKDSAPKRETFRPPWVKDKEADATPPWMQKRLKPVESTTKSATAEDEPAPVKKPALKRKFAICQILLH